MSFKFPPHTLTPTFTFKYPWERAKVYSWQQALVIKSFHWLISPYSSCTRGRQTRSDSPNDQRWSLSGGSNALCTCGTVTHSGCTCGTAFPSLSHANTGTSSLVKFSTCGRFPPWLLFLSWSAACSHGDAFQKNADTHPETEIMANLGAYTHRTHTHTQSQGNFHLISTEKRPWGTDEASCHLTLSLEKIVSFKKCSIGVVETS